MSNPRSTTVEVRQREGIKLLRGDSLEMMSSLAPGSIDLILADLPYGMTACQWDKIIPIESLWAAYRRLLKPSGVIVLTACQPFSSQLVTSNLKWFRYELIWDKIKVTGFLDAKRRPLRRHENILVFSPGRPKYEPQFTAGRPYKQTRKPRPIESIGDKKALQVEVTTVSDGRRYPTSILAVSNAKPKGQTYHPTQKPLELFEWLIRTYSDEGQTVLDNTMGSGTTLVAAANTGRKAIGIERDPGYFDVALHRVEEALEKQLAHAERR